MTIAGKKPLLTLCLMVGVFYQIMRKIEEKGESEEEKEEDEQEKKEEEEEGWEEEGNTCERATRQTRQKLWCLEKLNL